MARLVICDDETHITDILSRFFREKGHEVFGTTKGEEALAHVLDRSSDLVITDIAMKGLSGLDLLQRIKAAGLDIPVLITTGNPSHTSAVQALRGGAHDYVVKPFHLEEILERAERALATKRIREENLLYSKLVSLHALSRALPEAGDAGALADRVIQAGCRLTRSEAGWWLPGAAAADPSAGLPDIRPAPDSPGLRDALVRAARSALEKAEAVVAESSPGLPAPEAWFLSLPVATGVGAPGALVFRRAGPSGPADRYDAVDLEVANQLGSTFALGLRALGAGASSAPAGLGTGPAAASAAQGNLAATPGVLPAAAQGAAQGSGSAPGAAPGAAPSAEGAEPWARLVGRLVDEHCLGYQSKADRVAALGRDLARGLAWPDSLLSGWDVACRLYDLPKLRVPQRILGKPKALTEKEREFLRLQAAWARDCVDAVPGLSGAARLIEVMQERFDGAGPMGAKGKTIAPLARLLAVADAYVALRSERPYRPAYGPSQALDLVRVESGRRFDPDIVAALAESGAA